MRNCQRNDGDSNFRPLKLAFLLVFFHGKSNNKQINLRRIGSCSKEGKYLARSLGGRWVYRLFRNNQDLGEGIAGGAGRTTGSRLAGAGMGAASGAAAGSMFGPWGTAIGTVLGGVNGYMNGGGNASNAAAGIGRMAGNSPYRIIESPEVMQGF